MRDRDVSLTSDSIFLLFGGFMGGRREITGAVSGYLADRNMGGFVPSL
jgi:hypothetical protein